jgi:hypothetical protein
MSKFESLFIRKFANNETIPPQFRFFFVVGNGFFAHKNLPSSMYLTLDDLKRFLDWNMSDYVAVYPTIQSIIHEGRYPVSPSTSPTSSPTSSPVPTSSPTSPTSSPAFPTSSPASPTSFSASHSSPFPTSPTPSSSACCLLL